MSKLQFEVFIKHKKDFEREVIKRKPIIITTIGKATSEVLRRQKFKRVIMDEATTIKEYESFLGTLSAE